MSVEEFAVLGMMIIFSVVDIKKKQIPLALVAGFGIAVLLWNLFQGMEFAGMVWGLLPGIVCLLLSYVTEESIGRGDGLVLCALGMFCGVKVTVAVLGLGLIIAAMWAMILLLIKRAGKKTELPFLPCLSMGYLICLLG